jgi:signal transduction histidine kinase
VVGLRRLLHGPIRVWILTGFLAGITGIALVRYVAQDGPELPGPFVPWWLLAIAFGLAEVFVIHIRIARDAHSFSLSEIPLVIGLAFVPAAGIVLAQVIGVGAALTLHRRQRPIRAAFNLAQRSVTTTLAVWLFGLLHGALGPSWPAVWAAAILATLAADIVSAILINLAITLSEGGGRVLDQVVGPGTIFTMANTALALVAVMVMSVDPRGLILVAAPTVTTFLAGRAYSGLQRKHEELVLLQRSTRLAEISSDLEHMLPPILDHVREMFHADIAELVLWPEQPGDDHLATQLGPGEDRSLLRPEAPAPDRGVWARVSSEREGVLLPRPIRNAALAAYFAERGIVDAIVVPMLAEGNVTGILTVANRLGDFATFDEDDLRLLQVLANHVSVSVRNARLVEHLEAALDHERQAAKLKDDFVATISHELRTPLTNVQGYVKTLLNPAVALSTQERNDFLSSADRQAERLQVLIEDLLIMSRVEASYPRVAPDVLPLSDLIERIARDRAGPERIDRLVLAVPSDLPVVRTREEDVSRLIGNLVDNALKHSPPRTSVRVDARLESVGVRVSVEDQGTGIPLEQQEQIFDRFYQVDHGSTRRVGGAGMGLYICRRAAEALGARVWLERSSSRGSIFCAWLPFDVPLESSNPSSASKTPAAHLVSSVV